jgi:CRISPR system Cascade subunit CasC
MTEIITKKNYVNYHILISHSPSNLNRDDMNMQKTAVFGGTKRTRISSQSLKRAMRYSDYYKKNISQPSDRTRQLGKVTKKYTEALQSKYEESLIKSVMSLISGESEIKENTQSGAVAAWSVSEVEQYCKLYKNLQEQYPEPKDFDKTWKDATDKKKLLDDKTKISLFREALQNGKDIALSGRMATSGIMTTVDASLAVAHAITTHTVDTDIDWFTAVDDLNQETGETGSAHLDTTEFSSGVFYRYASLNLRQLQENLGNVDREQALDIAAHVLHLLATVVPSAKQNSFAAFNYADFALVSLSDQPISLANAFEDPVKKENGLMIPSIKALSRYHKTISDAYGLKDDKRALFSTKECNFENVTNKGSDFSALKEWLKKDGN